MNEVLPVGGFPPCRDDLQDRCVRFREIPFLQLPGGKPDESCVAGLNRRRLLRPTQPEVQIDRRVFITVNCLLEFDDGLNFEPGFLAAFPHSALASRLVGPAFPPRELRHPGHRPIIAAHADQITSVVFNDGDSDGDGI